MNPSEERDIMRRRNVAIIVLGAIALLCFGIHYITTHFK